MENTDEMRNPLRKIHMMLLMSTKRNDVLVISSQKHLLVHKREAGIGGCLNIDVEGEHPASTRFDQACAVRARVRNASVQYVWETERGGRGAREWL